MLGFAHMRYAESMREGMDVMSISLPFLEDLHRETDETTFLALLNSLHCVVMEVCGSIDTRISVGRGEVLPLHASAAGKAVLAFLSKRDRTRTLEGRLHAYTEFTISDAHNLDEHLAEIRRSGVSYNFQEFHQAINAMAVPLFNSDNKVIGSLALVGFSVDLDNHQMREYAVPFLEAAAAVSEKLGAQYPLHILDYHKLR
jgi:DNA-binding IclR family transcriptional regulator